MHLIAIDILAEARGLSEAVCGAGLALGVLLGLTGWWANRFWVVLAATIAGGMAGITQGASHGVQPMVAALGLAVAAGLTALLLVRFVVYAAVAFSFMFLIHLLVPRFDQPALSLLVGGMLGLYLYRFWMMALLSFLGALLTMYSGLCLLDALHTLDMMAWVSENAGSLDWACISLGFVFVLIQFALDQQRLGRKKDKRDFPWEKLLKSKKRIDDDADARSWLARSWQSLRRAG